ncbi:RBBP8 N-terminal-like protein [Bombina bombina]|uniref:RBBP8 N-terminal-like protein n=1 Tax=Bombina bombina TaxID=8345 RepID=UPI00235A5283|nr:RBBP8 N-terminal-like protein [Bombina bombina]
MAAENFIEALHRLKEIHEKEVLGMQAKLSELTMEKCRDGQRIEELFSKNHLLREQHKVLNENIKVLENRLRAGLCDRCTVTQELAKKKQQEFENSHLHNLQQISSLNSEMNNLKEEKRFLLEELKKLKNFDEINKPSRSHTPEDKLASDSPRSPTTSTSQKKALEQMSKDSETQESLSNYQIEDKSTVASRLSPGGKSSQVGIGCQDNCLQQMNFQNVTGAQKLFLSKPNQQRISNQLHGTIAVLRPGCKGGQVGMGTSPSLSKRTVNHDLHSKASSDSYATLSKFDSLKQVIPEEQLCLLSQHLAQRQLEQRCPGVSGEAMGRYLLTKSREAEMVKKRSQEDWDERAAMAELHGAVLYMREQGYRNRLMHPEERERLQYILTRQHQEQRSPKSPGEIPKSLERDGHQEGRLSLLEVLSKRLRNSYQDNHPEEQEWEVKASAVPEKEHEDESTPDKPLDLSDTKRAQLHQHNEHRKEHRGMFDTYSPTVSNSSPPKIAPSTDIVGEKEENRLTCKTEHERTEQKDIKNVLEPNPCLENKSESTRIKITTRGQKRECESEPDEEEESVEVQSNHEELDEVNTSCSEAETDTLWHAHTGSTREEFVQNKTKAEHKWGRKGTKASKKSSKRKRRVRDLPAESDTSHEGDYTR